MSEAAGYVKVMADYSSDGVWNREGAAIDAAEVPVSQQIRDRLDQWCQRYEESEFYLPAESRAPFDVAAFSKEGREIAEAIKAELPSWTVEYFDEARDAPDCVYEV